MRTDYHIIEVEQLESFKDSLINMKTSLIKMAADGYAFGCESTIPVNIISDIIKETDSEKDKKIYVLATKLMDKADYIQKNLEKTAALIDKLVEQIDKRYVIIQK